MTATVASTRRTADPQPTISARARWPALVVLCVGMLMIILDSTIVNVALPSIEEAPAEAGTQPAYSEAA